MALSMYSATLAPFSQEINNSNLVNSLQELESFLGRKPLKLLAWDEHHLAIPLNIPVELPPLGNFENIDIQQVEPVLVVINLGRYPLIPPTVFSDRLDFPKDRLAHLYVAKKGRPPAFCLIRGDISEWYANKHLKDLVIRIGNWFRDAATGQLTTDGNQFDPVRLEGYWGTVIYDYDQLADIVTGKKSFHLDSDFAIGLFERNFTNKEPVFKLNKLITPDNASATYDDFLKEKAKDAELPSKKHYHFGYIIWSNEEMVYNQYEVNFPSDWAELKTFCAQFGVSFQNLEKWIAADDPNTYVLVPVITGVKRPKPLIGFSGSIEFFNFCLRVDSPDVEEDRIVNNIPVTYQSHKQPLTLKKAREISGFKGNFGLYNLIVGCGALGSKITMHLARSGVTNYMLADPDELSPHNLVRHTALAHSEGLNKAELLKEEITNIYRYENLLTSTLAKSGETIFDSQLLKIFSWIFDFTASNGFSQSLVKAILPEHNQVCKSFLSNFGNLGILFLEGKGRNPRIDDLQITLYNQYRNMPTIAAWLQRESEKEISNLSVTVGIGCNSETIVLSDDVVSFHAAYFTGVINSEASQERSQSGKIYLNEINQLPFYSNTCHLIEVPRFDVLSAVNDSTWQVRFQAGLLERVKQQMEHAIPHETGGVLVGRASYKTKTIHVVDVLEAPPDSRANEACFFRGIEGLPEAIEEINTLSGNQLGYIGEWHSHPMGPNQLSKMDLNTVRKFKSYFESLPTPLPVFLVIMTPTHILPYVF